MRCPLFLEESVRTLVETGALTLPEHVERLAHHAFRGGAWEKAVSYGRQAGTKALARSANREAVTYFEHSLLALRQLSETRERLELAIDLRFNLQASLSPLGEIERMLAILHEAGELARALDDPRRLGWACAYGCFGLIQAGRLIDARGLGKQALAIAEMLDDRPIQVVASYYLAAAHVGSDYGAAAEGVPVSLAALLRDGPVVISFVRGRW